MKTNLKTRYVLRSSFLPVILALAAFAQAQPQKPVIDWTPGPFTAELGSVAEISVPKDFLFTSKKGAQKLLELTQNIPSGAEVGAIVPQRKGDEAIWFITFDFHEVGFVSDNEKDKMDVDALLKSIQDATEDNNKMRAEKGWPGFMWSDGNISHFMIKARII